MNVSVYYPLNYSYKISSLLFFAVSTGEFPVLLQYRICNEDCSSVRKLMRYLTKKSWAKFISHGNGDTSQGDIFLKTLANYFNTLPFYKTFICKII